MDSQLFSDNETISESAGETVHFYYNRARRLEHAPKIVQDHYNGTGPQVAKGLFRTLFATRMNRLMLLAVVVTAALTWLSVRHAPDPWAATIGTVQVTLGAFSYADTVYVSVTYAPLSGSDDTSAAVPVSAQLSCRDADGAAVVVEELTGEYVGNALSLRTYCTDYDIVSVTAVVAVGGETKTVTAPVERR
ncbi:MAG: hypothetical protein IJ191_01275 [Treponema sp.]|nr:hypothetical protein [Treponema sp.]